MKKQNKQFLVGLACPECGSLGPFYIDTMSVALVADTEILSVVGQDEWEYDSNCRCKACEHEEYLKGFYTGEPIRCPVPNDD